MQHIKVYDVDMSLLAILENAYKIGYTKEVNNIWTCTFKLPLDDPKQFDVIAKNYIELFDHDKRIGMFVVNPKKTVKNESERSITYNCEHVLSTLHSDVLFGYHQFTNYKTEDVLYWLLDQQLVRRWEIRNVEFTKYFSYSWENENSLLNAIVSVPKLFNESYLWTWDDTTYPFRLNLVKAVDEKVDIIRYGKNMRGIEKEEDPTGLVTFIYPLGYGEGVNQLNIKKVNNGQPFLRAEEAILDKYGVHTQIWIDKRIESSQTLKEAAQAILDQNKRPKITVSVDAIDYELIDPYRLVQYDVSKIVGVYDEETDTNDDLRIMKLTKPDIYGDPSNIQFELGNVRSDIGTTIVDLQKKQLVNDTYSQGATNIDSRDFQDNCDQTHPAIIRFPIPSDVVNINEMKLTFETQKFRAYERAIKGGGATISSTSAGGASTQTSSSGGGSTQTSSTGGQSTVTSASGGGTTATSSSYVEQHLMSGVPQNSVGTENWGYHLHEVVVPGHNHTVDIPSHTHSVSVPSHTHNVNTPAHTHDINIPAHAHDVTLPDHTHAIDFGIFELSETPSSIKIEVDGNLVEFNGTSGQDIDLIPYLSKDAGGMIKRGRYAEIKLTPDKLARINATVMSRLFIQSRIGGNY